MKTSEMIVLVGMELIGSVTVEIAEFAGKPTRIVKINITHMLQHIKNALVR